MVLCFNLKSLVHRNMFKYYISVYFIIIYYLLIGSILDTCLFIANSIGLMALFSFS